VHRGCKFAPRCPHVMPMCREAAPPLFQSDGASVSCYLYREAPVADGTETLTTAAKRGGEVPSVVASSDESSNNV
ncbi:MAG: hypothetical protein ACRDJH_18445, partial [Thermomicrobiales bacterium]